MTSGTDRRRGPGTTGRSESTTIHRVVSGPVAFAIVTAILIGATLAPDPAPLGAARVGALVVAVTGASLLVVRMGAADLATAAAVAAGAYLGGVGAALLGWPVLAAVPVAAAAGALIGAVSGALHVRVGRALGALTSLALASGIVAGLGGWPAGGGVAGFHAVPLLSRAGPQVEMAIVAAIVLAGLVLAWLVGSSRLAAAAAVAVRSPVIGASLGRRPVLDGAGLGAAAGALVGVGGATLAAIDGSVMPAGYGLQLAAAIALAALLGGVPPLGPVIGAVLVWGPGTIWPLVPLVGTAPPLLVTGPVGLAVLALRRGRPLVPPLTDVWYPGAGAARPRPPDRTLTLQVQGALTPSGPCHLAVHPGEVIALAGPNGAGKSTLLARIAGQLPDGGTVVLEGRPAPRSAVGRARAGVRRTWQRPPSVTVGDLARLVGADPQAAAAATWASDVLSGGSTASPDDTGVQQLVQLAASGPAVALLDEPTDVDAGRLSTLLRGLADAGSSVLVVDHRPEVLAAADRVERLGPGEVPS